MHNYGNSAFNFHNGGIPSLLPHPIFNPHQNNMVINGIPIPLNSSVFLSPDKNSMAELRFRTIQAQQNLVKNGLTSPRRFTTNAQMNTGATLSMPPPGLIPESLVRDILDLIKKEYPWAESLLASKMSKDQFKMFLDKLPELKNIITARMPVVPAASTPMLTGCPFSMHEVHAAAAMAAAAQSAREWERQNNKNPKRAPMKLFERLLQIKKVCEVGLLDEEILNEPLSPVTLSMILSMVNQVKKLAEARRALLAGKLKNPEDELAIRKRLFEMREYIREEQKTYIESLKRKPTEDVDTLEELMKRL